MTEHRYPEGNRLVLTLVGAVTTDGDDDTRSPGSVVVSIYEYRISDRFLGYLVRGHGMTGHEAPYELRAVHPGSTGWETQESAWQRAREMHARLTAFVASLPTETEAAS